MKNVRNMQEKVKIYHKFQSTIKIIKGALACYLRKRYSPY